MKTVLAAGSEYHRIDVVVDRYRDETIKGTTRTRCSKAARTIRRLVEGRDVGPTSTKALVECSVIG